MHDIANAVWSGFPAAFDYGVLAGIDYYTPSVDQTSTTVPLLNNSLLVALNSTWQRAANFQFLADGRFRAAAHSKQYWPPAGAKPCKKHSQKKKYFEAQLFLNFFIAPFLAHTLSIPKTWQSSKAPRELGVFIGGGSLQSLIWSAATQGLLNTTITNQNVKNNTFDS